MGILDTLLAILAVYYVVSVQSVHRPVIGILEQKDITNSCTSPFVIHGNYVKALEGAGALVVRVKVNQNVSYYRNIMSRMHGMMFSGGSVDLHNLDYTDAVISAKTIYNLAEELNNKGLHFPIWGVCQGLQLFAVISAGLKPLLTPCKGLNNAQRPLKFVTKPSESYMYRTFPEDVIEILTNESMVAHAHHLCITPEALKKHNLSSTWRVMTVARDDNGLELVTSMEHVRFPFVGLQFHPEKIIYDIFWGFKYRTDLKAILVNRWFFDWFIEDTKRNILPLQDIRDVKDILVENSCSSIQLTRDFISRKYLYVNPITDCKNGIANPNQSPALNADGSVNPNYKTINGQPHERNMGCVKFPVDIMLVVTVCAASLLRLVFWLSSRRLF